MKSKPTTGGTEPKILMSAKEVSDYTGLSVWAIEQLRREEQIPYIKIPGICRYYFGKNAIDEWLNKLQLANNS